MLLVDNYHTSYSHDGHDEADVFSDRNAFTYAEHADLISISSTRDDDHNADAEEDDERRRC